MRLPDSSNNWPLKGGEMAEAIRQTDWSLTPLGPSQQWPASLRMVVTTALDSPLPSLVMWGPVLTQIYYDAYRPFLGAAPPTCTGPGHPRVLAGSLKLQQAYFSTGDRRRKAGSP